MNGWVSSAAIVGLLVATIFYAWQRKLEHDFLFRQEKRQLYRKLISQLVRLRDHNFADDETFRREVTALQGLIYELDLVVGREMFPAAIAPKVVAEKLRRSYLSCEEKNIKFDVRSRENEILIAEFADAHDRLVQVMREDLRSTVSFLPRRRFKKSH